MGKADKLLLVLVCALLAFVGWRVIESPRRRPAVAAPAAQPADPREPASAPAATSAARSEPATDLHVSVRSSEEPPPLRDLADIRSRLAAGENGTYIADLLAAQDSVLFRWPERRVDAIRVWVDVARGMPGWNEDFAHMARSVFTEWAAAGSPLRFDFVVDSSDTDIKVRWVDTFGTNQIGSAARIVDQNDWIVGAEIRIAIRDSTGRAFSPIELAGIVRHEVGHALGLGHSGDRRTLMFPEETMYDIAPADAATLRLLYSLPPGTVREGEGAGAKAGNTGTQGTPGT